MIPEVPLAVTAAVLERRLRGELPGRVAQRRMAPSGRALPDPESVAATSRQAAVLVLLYPHDGHTHLLLTRRTETLAVHKGQISLPGGAREGAEGLRETALREAAEEAGIDPAGVRLIGTLTPIFIPVSGFLLTPFVGWTADRPGFRRDPIEVAALIETPLAKLFDPRRIRREEWTVGGSRMLVPFYSLGPHQVWGATAMILAELGDLLDDSNAVDRSDG